MRRRLPAQPRLAHRHLRPAPGGRAAPRAAADRAALDRGLSAHAEPAAGARRLGRPPRRRRAAHRRRRRPAARAAGLGQERGPQPAAAPAGRGTGGHQMSWIMCLLRSRLHAVKYGRQDPAHDTVVLVRVLLLFESAMYSAITPVLPHYAHALDASKPAVGVLAGAYP